VETGDGDPSSSRAAPGLAEHAAGTGGKPAPQPFAPGAGIARALAGAAAARIPCPHRRRRREFRFATPEKLKLETSMIRENPMRSLRTGSCYADADAARRALALVRPTVAALLEEPDAGGSGSCCVVIVDPAVTPHNGATFHDAVLVEDDFDTASNWGLDYSALAHAKARTAWLHGEDGLTLLTSRPCLLREGDSLQRGAICLDGIVVAVSGFAPAYDEALAIAIAAGLRAVAMTRLETARARQALVAGA
jgi:hypothetical protein